MQCIRLCPHRREGRRAGIFRGFPSYWNIYAFLCDVTIRTFDSSDTSQISLVVTSILVFFCVLSVLPVYFVYPTRVVRWKTFFTWGSAIWTLQCGAMILLYPEVPKWLYFSSLFSDNISTHGHDLDSGNPSTTQISIPIGPFSV